MSRVTYFIQPTDHNKRINCNESDVNVELSYSWIVLQNRKLRIVKTTFYTIYSDLFCIIIMNLKCITALNKQKVKELAREIAFAKTGRSRHLGN